MRRITNARAELQKLALRMRDAAHRTRRLEAENDMTAIAISQEPYVRQRHNVTFPGANRHPHLAATLTTDTSEACFLSQLECKVYTVEVKGLAHD